MSSLGESRYFGLLFSNGITSNDLETELADQNNLNDFIYLFRNYSNKVLLFKMAWDILAGSATAAKYSVLGTAAFLALMDWSNVKENFFMPASTETPFPFYATYTPDSQTLGYATTSAPKYLKGFGYRGNYIDSSSSYYDFLFAVDFTTRTLYSTGAGTNSTGNAAGGVGLQTEFYGYYMGGQRSTGSTYMNAIWKQTFANLYSLSIISATSNDFRQSAGASGLTNGLVFGGFNSTYHSNVSRFVFSTEVYTSYLTTIANGTFETGAGQTGDTAYLFGSYNGTYYNYIQKTNCSSISMSTISATLAAASFGHAVSSLKSAAYLAGGAASSGALNTLQKFIWSGETISTLSATIGFKRQYGRGMHGATL